MEPINKFKLYICYSVKFNILKVSCKWPQYFVHVEDKNSTDAHRTLKEMIMIKTCSARFIVLAGLYYINHLICFIKFSVG